MGKHKVKTHRKSKYEKDGAYGSRSATYRIWAGMKSRCSNPKNQEYHRYGGRGISVCNRWIEYGNFLEDVGERPLGPTRFTIERTNNDGNYEPGNVVWATYREQGKNKSITYPVEHNGVTETLAGWARILGFSRETLAWRIRSGMSIAEAFSPPFTQSKPRRGTDKIEYDGETLSILEWSRRSGIDYRVMWNRFRSGWPADKAIFSPIGYRHFKRHGRLLNNTN